MITMKGFFLFIVINVFVLNSIVFAGKDKMKKAENIYEFNIKVGGKFVKWDQYKDKVLIISHLFTNLEHNINYSNLMYLAEKYYPYGLRVLGFFSDQLNNLEKIEDEPKGHIIDLMNKKKIKIVYGRELQNLLKFMNSNPVMKMKITNYGNSNFSSRFIHHTFLVNRNGIVIPGGVKKINMDKIFIEITERELMYELKPWNYINSLYELRVKKYNGDSVSMNEYRNKVIIISFIREGSKLKNEKKIQSMLKLANNFNSENVKILIIMNIHVKNKQECARTLINENRKEAKVHILQDNEDSYTLMQFLKLKIEVIDSPRKTYQIKDFIIKKEEDVIMEFLVDLSKEITEITLRRYLELWNFINSVYELEIKNYNGVSVPMDEYRNKMLIVSFICEKTIMENEKKFQSMLNLANNFNSDNVKILVIMGSSIKDKLEYPVKLLSENRRKSKVHLFQDNEDSDILMYFLKLKLKVIDCSRETDLIKDIIIHKDGEVFIEFMVDLLIEMTERTLIRYLEVWNFTNSVYELEVKNYNEVSVPMKNYRNNVLIVSFICEKTIMENEKKYQSIIKLANNFNSENVKFLVIMGSSIKDKLEYPVKLISENREEGKVHLFQDNEDSNILMYYLKLKIEVIDNSRKTYKIRDFVISKEEDIILEFMVDLSMEITERTLIRYLELWNFPNSVYELEVTNYNGVSVPMIKYRNQVLIVSFICEKTIMENEKKFQSMVKLANNSENLKVLVIMGSSIKDALEYPVKLISENREEAKIHLFQNNEDSDILMYFLRLNIEVIDRSKKTYQIKNYIINREGYGIIEYKINSSMEEINKMLREHVKWRNT